MLGAFTIPTIFTVGDQLTGPVRRMQASVKAFSKSLKNSIAPVAAMGTAITAPLLAATKYAIDFEDKMADIAKTTGMSKGDLSTYGKELLAYSKTTRSSIEELQGIGEIGGKLGITAREELTAFTKVVDQFNVALGSDFTGGVEEATRAIGGLHKLFRETRNMDIADAITKSGSAINAISAKGVLVPELTEFALRVGQLPDAIKPTIQDVISLGAVFNKAGISAEIASRATGDILLTAAQNLPAFAKQMHLSAAAVKELINEQPALFMGKFAESLKGVDATKFAKLTKDLKLADSGSIKAIGALSSSLDQLAEFQDIANTEFAKGTSLAAEYAVKNNTMAGKVAKLKNQMHAFAIDIGNAVVPSINKLMDKLSPIITQVTDWIGKNHQLLDALLPLGGVLVAASAGMWLLNVAMDANPAGAFVVAIGAVVTAIGIMSAESRDAAGALGAITNSWAEWGKVLVAEILLPLTAIKATLLIIYDIVRGKFIDATVDVFAGVNDLINAQAAIYGQMAAATGATYDGYKMGQAEFDQRKSNQGADWAASRPWLSNNKAWAKGGSPFAGYSAMQEVAPVKDMPKFDPYDSHSVNFFGPAKADSEAQTVYNPQIAQGNQQLSNIERILSGQAKQIADAIKGQPLQINVNGEKVTTKQGRTTGAVPINVSDTNGEAGNK